MYKKESRRQSGVHAGVVEVYAPHHPKARKRGKLKGYYFKHIMMMEEKLGRYIRPGEIVKFKDNNKFNCTIDNLYVADISNSPDMIRKYKWIVLTYIFKDPYCTMTEIKDYLIKNYSELAERDLRYPRNTYYMVKNTMQWFRINKYVIGEGVWRKEHYCTLKGREEVKKCIKDGRSPDLYVEPITGVLR